MKGISLFHLYSALLLLPVTGVLFNAHSEETIPPSNHKLELSIDSIENHILSGDSIGKALVHRALTRPKRPVGNTIAGIVLTVWGVSSGAVGIFYLSIDGGFEQIDHSFSPVRLYGVLYTITGIGELIPGIINISIARRKWKVYNDWEKANAFRDDREIYVNYTFDF
jgi:hypothetical protein